jgi:hypothetical protein
MTTLLNLLRPLFWGLMIAIVFTVVIEWSMVRGALKVCETNSVTWSGWGKVTCNRGENPCTTSPR